MFRCLKMGFFSKSGQPHMEATHRLQPRWLNSATKAVQPTIMLHYIGMRQQSGSMHTERVRVIIGHWACKLMN